MEATSPGHCHKLKNLLPLQLLLEEVLPVVGLLQLRVGLLLVEVLLLQLEASDG